jgi:hypothetical protein
MKKLPQYFVIKRQADNPLWVNYITWLNKTYNQRPIWLGDIYNYYGYDGNFKNNGTKQDFLLLLHYHILT